MHEECTMSILAATGRKEDSSRESQPGEAEGRRVSWSLLCLKLVSSP